MTAFIQNAWYVAAFSSELNGGGMLARTILETPVVMFRDDEGLPVALLDRCPHRFAPLHLGKLENGIITCGYHGLRFDRHGACTFNPHGEGHIPDGTPVPTFPIAESQGLVWIWAGAEHDGAIPEPPRLAFLDDCATLPSFTGYLPTAAGYSLILDNLMDLSHADYLHPDLIGTGGAVSASIPTVRGDDDMIESRWEWEGGPAMGLFAPFLPGEGRSSRGWLSVKWLSPSNIVIASGASALERPEEEVATFALHALTPADATNSHYFYLVYRNYAVDDESYTELIAEGARKAFAEEDKPMLEAVQKRMGSSNFWDLRPWLLSGDRGPVRVRRAIEKRIRSEEKAHSAA